MTTALTTLRDNLLRLLHRELVTVEREVLTYPDDDALWREVPGVSNSGGTLALHLVGNLRHFIGTLLGGSAFVRDRDAEFSSRGQTRAHVAQLIRETVDEVTRTIISLDPARLAQPFPATVGPGIALGADIMLMHLASHTAYHLGQIDYHRRITTGDPTTVATLPLTALTGAMPAARDAALRSSAADA